MSSGEDPAATDAVFVLEPGVPYPRRWAQAHDTAVMLRGELHRLGLVELAGRVRAEVSTAGVGVVDLGAVSPQAARALAELLAMIQPETGPAAPPCPQVA